MKKNVAYASDSHGRFLLDLSEREVDFLFLVGDYCNGRTPLKDQFESFEVFLLDIRDQLREYLERTGRFLVKNIVGCWGNHDHFAMFEKYQKKIEKLFSSFEGLVNNTHIDFMSYRLIDGVSVGVCGFTEVNMREVPTVVDWHYQRLDWTPEIRKGAVELFRGKRVDVMITHAPIKGIGLGVDYDGVDIGESFLGFVRELVVGTQLWISGHVHKWRAPFSLDETSFETGVLQEGQLVPDSQVKRVPPKYTTLNSNSED